MVRPRPAARRTRASLAGAAIAATRATQRARVRRWQPWSRAISARAASSSTVRATARLTTHATAAAFYRQAFDFVTHPSRRDHHDGADYYREQMEREERLAGLR